MLLHLPLLLGLLYLDAQVFAKLSLHVTLFLVFDLDVINVFLDLVEVVPLHELIVVLTLLEVLLKFTTCLLDAAARVHFIHRFLLDIEPSLGQ